ncbi:putative peptidase, partial [Cardiosporidium cionae]
GFLCYVTLPFSMAPSKLFLAAICKERSARLPVSIFLPARFAHFDVLLAPGSNASPKCPLQPAKFHPLAGLSTVFKVCKKLRKLKKHLRLQSRRSPSFRAATLGTIAADDPTHVLQNAACLSHLCSVASCEISKSLFWPILQWKLETSLYGTIKQWIESNEDAAQKFIQSSIAKDFFIGITQKKDSSISDFMEMHRACRSYQNLINARENSYFIIKGSDIFANSEWKEQFKTKGSNNLKIPLSCSNVYFVVGSIPDESIRRKALQTYYQAFQSQELDLLFLEILKRRQRIAFVSGQPCWTAFAMQRRMQESSNFRNFPAFFDTLSQSIQPLVNELMKKVQSGQQAAMFGSTLLSKQ